MENILVYPSSESERTLLENLLFKMKISFEKIKDDKIVLSEEEMADIEAGIEDFENGKTYTNDEVLKMMKECLK